MRMRKQCVPGLLLPQFQKAWVQGYLKVHLHELNPQVLHSACGLHSTVQQTSVQEPHCEWPGTS